VGDLRVNIDDVDVYKTEDGKYKGIRISWSANIGWGEYTFYVEDGKWYADSECMGEDFGRMLLEKFMDQVIVR
jgi:hypothetical protein